MSRMYLRGVAAVAAALMLLSACGSGGSGGSGDGGDGGTLRVANSIDISSMDPIRGNSGDDHQMLYPLYDTLISFDKQVEPVPGLAESWDYTSPTELVLQLREGVKFHDGEAFDAEAVKYNLERAAGEGSNIAADVESIESVEVTDDLTVQLNLSHPDSAMVLILTDRAGMMVSPKAAEEADGDLSTNPVGTGGWSFVEWKRGSTVTYEKFADYWDADVDRVDKIIISILSDSKTRVTGLRSGKLDIAWNVAPSDVEVLETSEGVGIDESPRMYVWQIYLNNKSPELKDARVRRALSMAVDREVLAEVGFFGLAEPANSGFLPKGYWAEPPAEAEVKQDVEEARKLLKEAGADGMSFNMLVYGIPEVTRFAEILKEQFAEIGVTVNLVPRDINQANDAYFNDKKEPALLAPWTGRPDPALTYRLMFTAEGFFSSGVSSPGIEKALEQDAETTDLDDRKKALDKAAIAVAEDAPIIPLFFQDSLTGVSDNVEGFENNLLGKPKLLGVTLN